MKQESTKKTKKWLLPVIIAAAVLVVAGIVLALVLGPQNGGSDTVQSDLYWNVDREANVDDESGMSIREPGSDGLYTIRFAVGGEQVEYKAADKRLVNRIDFLDVMGLAFDADGLIIDAYEPKTVATEVAKDFFVQERKGDVLVVNSSQAMNGMRLEVNITENTGIYNVSATAAVVGEVTDEFEVMDKVLVYANAEGENTHIFITQRFVEAGVYYRLNRMYNADTASTSRVPDENGVYTIPFAYEGEQIELKCKDRDLVSSIDAGSKISSPQMGLLFDEEGYIIKKIPVTEALRGKLLCSYFHVEAINGTTVDLLSRWGGLSSKGDTCSFELPEDFDDIFLMEADCHAEFMGQRVDTLQAGDQVYVYTDFDNNPLLIYIARRVTGYPIYYNITRSYNSTLKETKRKVDDNGYYVFEMVCDGKEVTLKTKDKAIASEVDKFDRYLMGLKVEGNIIVDVCAPECVTGRATAGNNRYVTENLGTIVRMVSPADFTSGANYVLSPNYKVYDVSGAYGVPYGTETTLRPGDRAQATRNPEGELLSIFVTYRYEEKSKLYFFPSRYYDSATKQTKREPDAEGYYVFENMMCDGKNETLKTKDKGLASYIDKQSSKFVALEVSNGIIKKAYTAVTAIKYGYMTMKGVYYDKIDEDGMFNYYSLSNGERVYKTGHKIAEKCDAFNVSTVYNNFRGEKSKLQKDDYYYAFGSRENFQITKVFIRDRQVDSPLYWPVSPQFDDATGETTRVPDGDGYYWIEVIADGKVVKLKTKDKALASKVDDYNYAFALKLNGDEILNVYSATSARAIDSYDYRDTYVKAIEGNKVILMDPRPTSENYGKDLVLEFTSKSKIYDAYLGSDTYGQATELRVGDKICSYQDEKGKVVYCFIKSRGAYLGSCDACYQQALAAGATEAEAKKMADGKLWEVYTQNTAEDGLLLSSHRGKHYYLAADQVVTNSRFLRIYGNFTVCLDLNGHTVTKSLTKADGTDCALASVLGVDGGEGASPVLNVMDSKGTAIITGRANRSTTRGSAIRVNKGTCNVYGGTFRRTEDAYNQRLVTLAAGTTLNIYGGTFDGQIYSATDVKQIALRDATRDTVYVVSDSTLNVYGGNIAGSVDVREGATLNLIGAPKISTLKLAGTAVANIDKLSANAKIGLGITENKVITKPSGNAAAAKDAFIPATKYDFLTIDNKALVYNVGIMPVADKIELGNSIAENSAKQDFTNYAGERVMCYACGKEVVWTAVDENNLPANGRFVPSAGHYYLAQDNIRTEDDTSYVIYIQNNVCLHLNGKTISAIGADTVPIYVGEGTANIMGNGTIIGQRTESVAGDALRVRNPEVVVNLYGGTYMNNGNDKPIVAADANGATLNVYGFEKEGVYYGAKIDGGDAASEYASVYLPKVTTFNMYGGIINDGLYASENVTLMLAGAPVITKPARGTGLSLDGTVANIDNLLPEAQIAVDGEDGKILTASSDNITAVKDCFTVETGMLLQVTEDNCLKVIADTIPWTENALTTDFDPAANRSLGYCEACYKQALAAGKTEAEAQAASMQRWTAYDGTGYEKNQHYYLTADYTIDAAGTRFVSIIGGTTCLNLNGHSVTMSGEANRAMIRAYGDSSTLNLMDAKGTGVLTGNGEHYSGSGSVIESRVGSPTINIYGGTLQSASAKSSVGVHHSETTPNLNIYGGTIAGIKTREGTTLTLSGALQISGLVLGEGVVANIDELATTAQIAVEGEAGKVISNVSNNAAAVKDCFTAGAELDVEVNADGALEIVAATVPQPPVTSTIVDPSTATTVAGVEEAAGANIEIVKQWIETYGALFQAQDKLSLNAKVQAPCPFCSPNENVTWTGCTQFTNALTTNGNNTLAAGAHSYLIADRTADKTNFMTTDSANPDTARCVYLNGFGATGTMQRFWIGRSLNIIAYGSTFKRTNGEGVTPLFQMNAGACNVYGGTFINEDPEFPLIRAGSDNTNSQISLYDGTYTSTVNNVFGSLAEKAATLNIYGSKLTGGIGMTDCVSGAVNIYNAKADATYTTEITGTVTVDIGSLTIGGGNIAGVAAAEGVTLTLAGAPKINGLTLKDAAIANIDNLQPEAQIAVAGQDGKVISNVSDNAAAVKDCFNAGTDMAVEVDANGALVMVSVGLPAITETTFTTDWAPNAEGYAYCEACYKQAIAEGKSEDEAKEASWKQWTVFTGGEAVKNTHYYLNQSFENYGDSENTRFLAFSKTGTVCWNLNGNSVSMASTGQAMIRAYTNGTINIMDAKGTGVLTGYDYNSKAGTNGGSVVEVRGSGILNIYGGTLRRAEGVGGHAAVGSHGSSYTGTINVYGGTIDGLFVRAGGQTSLAGAPTITELSVGSDAVVNIDGLLPGAAISVKGAEGKVISNVSDNAAAVANCFTTVTEGLDVVVGETGALVIATAEPNPAQFVVDWVATNGAAFRAEDKLTEGATVEAPCPVCSPDANVVWTGIDGIDDNALADGCHVYLVADRSVDNKHNFLVGDSAATSHCVYFNGFNVGNGENNSATRIRARGNMNIIAYGSTITRSANCVAKTETYGTMMLQGGGVATFYGGTYINNDSRVNLVANTKSEYTLNFYDVTLIDNANSVIVNKGTMALYNCTVNGIATTAAIDAQGGSLTLNNGVVNGSINVAEDAELILVGRPVLNKLENGTGVTLNGAAVINVDGLKLGAQIAIEGEADKVISNVSENVSVAQKCFKANEGLEVTVTDGALVLAQAVQPAQLALEEQDESSVAVKN